jgi:regulator of protease activity HflC (stomatin/prohibitin superfamily)
MSYSQITKSKVPVGGVTIRVLGTLLIILGLIGIPVSIFITSIRLGVGITITIILLILGFILAGVYIIPEWIRVPVLLLGKYKKMKGPGMFWLFPALYTIPYALDMRIITTIFSAEQTLTEDNVPVNVDAVLFWQVVDPFKASIKVQDYQNAITWAAQTSLRDIIGKTDLSNMLVGREHMAHELERIIDERTETWGVKSISVEIRDVVIPTVLQDAMSRQAQAERERQARIILASSEEQIAEKFLNAAKKYEEDAVAINLRAMNILYESMKEKGAWIIVPSDMVSLLGGSLSIGNKVTEKNKEK